MAPRRLSALNTKETPSSFHFRRRNVYISGLNTQERGREGEQAASVGGGPDDIKCVGTRSETAMGRKLSGYDEE